MSTNSNDLKNAALDHREASLLAENMRLSGILSQFLQQNGLDRTSIAAFESNLSEADAQAWAQQKTQLSYTLGQGNLSLSASQDDCPSNTNIPCTSSPVSSPVSSPNYLIKI